MYSNQQLYNVNYVEWKHRLAQDRPLHTRQSKETT